MNVSPVIAVRDLSKHYVIDRNSIAPVLKNVTFSIQEGEFVSIMGPSGSGKSTLLNILGCLDTQSSGDYILGGQNTSRMHEDEQAQARNRLLGFVFQNFNLLPRKDALHNVMLPLVYAGVEHTQQVERAQAMLEKVGLLHLKRSLPAQMSGGQQQRVAIARALASNPKVILADEPTGNLDSETSKEIMEMLTSLNEKEGITVLIITHDANIAHYTHRLITIQDGQILHDGKPAEWLNRTV